MSLKVAIFCHSLVSDWNHGNAHFLRGIVSELQARAHQVRVFEPDDAWSRENLVRDHGPQALDDFRRSFPSLTSSSYDSNLLDLDRWLEDADLILVHEWNDPRLVSAVGEYRRRNPLVRLLFHDTHHRAVTAPEQLARFDLSNFDGVLVYGQSLKKAYQKLGWGKQVQVWHEAADIRVFHPRGSIAKLGDLVWIGNWGDDERTAELREYLIDPCAQLGLEASAYGVRYPEQLSVTSKLAGLHTGVGSPITKRLRSLRNLRQRFMFRGALILSSCPVSRRFAPLKRLPAAFH